MQSEFPLKSLTVFILHLAFSALIPEVTATDPDAICPMRAIQCVECSTRKDQEYCSDPFNKTLLTKNLLKFETCDGYCVKWIRRSFDDPESKQEYIRTCSKNLVIKLPINVVCIYESRSGNGKMCFCNKDECNAAPSGRRRLDRPSFLLSMLMISSCVFLILIQQVTV